MRRATTSAADYLTTLRIPAAKTRRVTVGLFKVLIVTTLLMLTPALLVAADDGPLVQRNLSNTPGLHSEHAAIGVMPLYVAAQDTQGEPPDTTSGELEYWVGDCTNQDTSGCTLASTRPVAWFLSIRFSGMTTGTNEIGRIASNLPNRHPVERPGGGARW